MIMEMADLPPIDDPDEKVVAHELRNLHSRQFPYLILMRTTDGNDYLQVFMDEHHGIHVEYRDGLAKKHFEVSELSIEEVIPIFEDYLRLGSSWQSEVAWKDVSQNFDWNIPNTISAPPEPEQIVGCPTGVVYLLKAGPYYKIGKAKNMEQRLNQIRLQLPYSLEVRVCPRIS